ncbi:MAG TPA: hypothetical protein VIK33_17690, partial [Anaerolineae bacterium]
TVSRSDCEQAIRSMCEKLKEDEHYGYLAKLTIAALDEGKRSIDHVLPLVEHRIASMKIEISGKRSFDRVLAGAR